MNYSQDEDIIPILICNISYSSETYLWFSPRFFPVADTHDRHINAATVHSTKLDTERGRISNANTMKASWHIKATCGTSKIAIETCVVPTVSTMLNGSFCALAPAWYGGSCWRRTDIHTPA
jgi:hypothetical protein